MHQKPLGLLLNFKVGFTPSLSSCPAWRPREWFPRNLLPTWRAWRVSHTRNGLSYWSRSVMPLNTDDQFLSVLALLRNFSGYEVEFSWRETVIGRARGFMVTKIQICWAALWIAGLRSHRQGLGLQRGRWEGAFFLMEGQAVRAWWSCCLSSVASGTSSRLGKRRLKSHSTFGVRLRPY